jgi:hypothetical protein
LSRTAAQTLFAAAAIVAAASTPDALTASRPASEPSRPAAPRPGDSHGPAVAVQQAYLRTPLRFEPQPGAEGRDYVARGAGYAVYLSGGNAMLALTAPDSTTVTLSMRLAGGRASAKASPGKPLSGTSNHLIGSDPARWQTGVRSFGEIRYENVYPGIDLVYYGSQRQLEYDFVVQPGATPSNIAFVVEGAQAVDVDAGGNLRIATKAGTLTQRAPVLYQEIAGVRRPVTGGYVVSAGGHVAFAVGSYDASETLVIDPVLSYASYLGGSSEERLNSVAIDAAGNVVVAGTTYSTDFPVAAATQAGNNGSGDAFVAKLTPAGDGLVFATYLGGVLGDSAESVSVAADGAIYVTGSTTSWDFPTLNAFQSENLGQADAFVVKLDAAGALVYSTLLGGILEDYATSIAVDASGRAHIAGSTRSADFPTAGAIQRSLGGSPVFRTTDAGATWIPLGKGLRASGIRAFAIDPAAPETVYAGTEMEGIFKSTDGGATWAPTGREIAGWQVNALAVGDGSPAAVYAATRYGVYRSVDGGGTWAPVLVGSATAVVASPQSRTVYAGLDTNGYPYGVFKSADGGDSWSSTGLIESVNGLAVSGSTLYAATSGGVFTSAGDAVWAAASGGLFSQPAAIVADAGNPSAAYVATADGLFKTTTAGASWSVVPGLAGVPIASLAISASDPSTLIAPLLSGGTAITSDGGGSWRVTPSESGMFSAVAIHPGSPAVAYLGGMLSADAFVATVAADGRAIEFSTFFGGSGHERVTDIAVDAAGARVIVGETNSPDLPLSNALQPSFGGLQDAFVARFGPEGLTYSTYLGGSGFESAPRVALDASGQAHVAGLTWSSDFPTANAVQPQPAGGYSDLFVSVLTPNGSFTYSTYLGGAAAETDSTQTLGPDVAVTSSGDTYVTGTTMSMNFPTSPDALQATHGGGSNDAFLTRFDPLGRPKYSTYLGGSGDDYGRSVAIGAGGDVAVAGYTSSASFPVRNALQPAPAGSDDGFVARFSVEAAPADTEAPVTALALGGTSGESGWYRSAVAVTLSARDNDGGSGVAAIQYRLNGGPLQNYAGPFTISSDGITSVTAYATDVAGNVEAPAAAAVVRIDTNAPVVALSSPQAGEYLYNRVVNVSASVDESLSGLAAPAAVALDGAPFAGSVLAMSTLPPGAHTLTATATDRAGNTGRASVRFSVLANRAPVVDAGADRTVSAAADCLGRVVLTASATDPDGDVLTLAWSGAASGSGGSVSLALPVGTHVVTVTADDGNGGRSADTVIVTVADTTAPVISSIAATPSVIEKANHSMVPVVVSPSASDGCGAVDCRIVSVTSNEAGDDDWQITGNLTVNVRAERAGKGTGRVYTITVACTDAAGNVATSTVTVAVPR